MADVTERNPRKLVTNISSVYRPTGPAMESGSISDPTKLAERKSIVALPLAETPLHSPEISMGSVHRSHSMGTLYFSSHQDNSTLERLALPTQPGTESEVDGLPRLIGSEQWILSAGGIYFIPAEAPRSLRYFDIASKQIRPIFEVDNDFSSGLSVSPGGRWNLYSQVGDVNSGIMLVDHFR